jgi:hypothetical protein
MGSDAGTRGVRGASYGAPPVLARAFRDHSDHPVLRAGHGSRAAFRSEVEVFGGADGGVRGRQQEGTDDLGDQAEILGTLSGLRAWIVPAPAAWLAKI